MGNKMDFSGEPGTSAARSETGRSPGTVEGMAIQRHDFSPSHLDGKAAAHASDQLRHEPLAAQHGEQRVAEEAARVRRAGDPVGLPRWATSSGDAHVAPPVATRTQRSSIRAGAVPKLASCRSQQLVPPEALEPIRHQCVIADRVLDIVMPQVSLQGPRIDAVIRKLVARAWRSIWACALMPSFIWRTSRCNCSI
jgi:hypothetical protein